MKKLGRIKLTEAKIMGAEEMKMILGGQSGDDLCKQTSKSFSFADGTGSGNDEIQCGGRCPTETVTGNTPKQTCEKDTQRINGKPITICMCK